MSWEDLLEKGMATHSCILAWRIPWTEEPGGLQSMGSQRVGHDWDDSTHLIRFLIQLASLFPPLCSVERGHSPLNLSSSSVWAENTSQIIFGDDDISLRNTFKTFIFPGSGKAFPLSGIFKTSTVIWRALCCKALRTHAFPLPLIK